jgi:uncharacterized protein YbjT (DUF2867 family)
MNVEDIVKARADGELRRVLVVGGTGLIGAPVVRALASAGFEVSALVRGEARGLPEGVKVIKGDILSAEDMDRAVAGQDAVYLSLSTRPADREHDRLPEREGVKNVLEAARKAGVRRVLLLTALMKDYQGTKGFDWWVLRVKQEAEIAVRTSGVPHTIFRASSFLENLQSSMRQGSKINVAGKSKYPMWYIAADDFAAMVVASLASPASRDRVYTVQGPEALLASELAARYVKSYTQAPLTVAHAPLGLLKALGLFSRDLSFASKVLEALNEYPERFDGAAAWAELARPQTTVEDFARRGG